MDSKYVYSPLTKNDGIRVLLLEPAESQDDDLKGSLEEISLAEHYDELIEPYTALSYVWGENHKPVDKILIGDYELGIAANLNAALRDLRDTRRTHRLWVDAACINQENITERSAQVALMGRIFTGANNTIIYLGLPNPYIDAIIELVKHHIHCGLPETIYFNLPIAGGDNGSTGDGFSLIDAVYKGLLVSPWFRRVWILQELVLSREPWVQYGRKRIRWPDLCRFIIPQLEQHRREETMRRGCEPDKFTDLESMNGLRMDYWGSHTSRGNKLKLWEILESRRDCQASDPRDRIFAYMGIISDRHEAEKFIKIDYSQTAWEVFAMAGHYYCYYTTFWTMAKEIIPSPFRTMIPSWAPDWGVNVDKRYPREERSFDRAMHLKIRRAAKILQLSDVLPTPFSLQNELYARGYGLVQVGAFVRIEPSWREFVSVLPRTTKDSTGRLVNLRYWPKKIGRLSGIKERNMIIEASCSFDSLLVDYVWQYWGRDEKIIDCDSRLALLSDGDVIIVPYEAQCGDIVAHFREQFKDFTLTTRPCEPYNTIALDGIDRESRVFQHCSLVGACEYGNGMREHFLFANVNDSRWDDSWKHIGQKKTSIDNKDQSPADYWVIDSEERGSIDFGEVSSPVIMVLY
ncbi:heterokaryon incompatibility protein-domain-containing protein [Nemania abortiva]|nr:heterokaryon incompatibility protein-domain-containing protein [Nemania abortiva]